MKTILITGGNGFTGTAACSHFRKQGYQVITTKRSGKDLADELLCDLTKKEEVDQTLKKANPDYILHLAGKNHAGDSWVDPEIFMKVNVEGTLHLLESVRRICPKVRILIIGSALEICPALDKPNHPYGYSKAMQTSLAIAWHHFYQMNVLVVKPPNLIGPGPSTGVSALFAQKVVKGEKEGGAILEINTASSPKTFLDVRDAVKAYEKILDKGKAGVVYELAGGSLCTLEELANHYKELSEGPVIIRMRMMGEEESMEKRIEGNQLFGRYAEKWRIVPCYSLQGSVKDTLDYFRVKC